MIKRPFRCFLWVLVGLFATGCASRSPVGSAEPDFDPSSVAVASVKHSALPPLDSSEAGKFSQKNDESLIVATEASEQLEADAAAFQSLETGPRIGNQVVGANAKILGQWVVRTRAQEKVDKLSKLTALASRLFDHPETRQNQICQIQLGEESVEGGYKADGAAACPTKLFMLESWRPYGEKVILRNHMGDEIVRLSSRSSKMWVGIDEQGETYVLERTKSSDRPKS